MTVTEELIRKIIRLTPAGQREVLELVDRLAADSGAEPRPARQSAYGAWADLDIDISLEEFRQNREAMWGRSTDEEVS